MQVGLHTSTLSNTGGLAPSTLKPQALERPAATKAKDPAQVSEYPASPLLTTRPQRYSVQLNDQLTTLQQADSYLGNLEQKLLDYRHVTQSGGRRGRDSGAAAQLSTEVQTLLATRSKRTGGAVDRQLMPVLQGDAQVRFHSPGLSSLFAPDAQPESLLFSVHDGRKMQLSAVSVDEANDERQYVTQVSNALRRVGVRVNKGRDETGFSVKEHDWAQLQRSFSVMGEGKQFAAAVKTPLTPVAEPCLADRLAEALSSGNGGAAQSAVQDTLNQLSEQRERLAAQQEKARQLVDGMARFPETQSAEQASQALSSSLDGASHNYDLLAQAVNGQANLSKLTVRSLLR